MQVAPPFRLILAKGGMIVFSHRIRIAFFNYAAALRTVVDGCASSL